MSGNGSAKEIIKQMIEGSTIKTHGMFHGRHLCLNLDHFIIPFDRANNKYSSPNSIGYGIVTRFNR